jgi:Tol biopolymer transport system component
MRKAFLLIILLAFLASCDVPAGEKGAAIPTGTYLPGTPNATIPIAPPPEKVEAPTLALNPTATLETRLPPERWQEWPIVPMVTKRAIEIYRRGQGMGLDAHAFSKVGDCQSIKEAFMGYFDIPERYSLGKDYAYLQQTVDAFAGHFNTDGQAVRGGFNAAAVLSPLWADPKVCLAGETPLDCELRVTKPIIVIVSLEVWWDGRTAQQYGTLMRRILDTIIAHGAVPILATKADNVEGDNSLNLTTARLAYEYDLPLWNFWAAVQPLPAHGMDIKRNDGFHISTDAWSTRSFTGLEALDSIWRGLLEAIPATTANPGSILTATPGVIATVGQNPTPIDSPKITTASPDFSGQIVFGLAKRQGDGYTYSGVYILDLGTQQTRQIFDAGVRLQSVSPDGKYLLVSEGSALYRTTVEEAGLVQLTASLYPFGTTDAIWLPDGRIAAVLSNSTGTGISVLSTDGVAVTELPGTGASPIEIYPTSDSRHIYWESGSCSSPGVCQSSGTWATSLDGKLNKMLEGITRPALAPDGKTLVSAVSGGSAQNNLIIASPDGSNIRPYPLPGNILVDYAWSPSGDMVAAVVAMRSDYSGRVSGNRNFMVDAHSLAVSEYPQSNLFNPRLLWSPDGSFLLWVGTLPGDNGFMISGALVNRASKQVYDLGAAFGETSPDFLLVTNAGWLAIP